MKHPAKYSNPILDVMQEMLVDVSGILLDPFAGTGKIHLLQREDLKTFGVEIEPEWATLHPQTIVGDALNLPFADASFDAIATSPTYGNRMADHHNAKDGSKRNTYKHTLGRDLHPNNSGQLQWGPKYREFHEKVWAECIRVLKPNGTFILNISNHIRKGEEIDVTDWQVRTIQQYIPIKDVRTVGTIRYKEGSNSSLRPDHESVVRFLKPDS
jgi:DNA modification methylase